MAQVQRESVVNENDVALAEAIQACGGGTHETMASPIRAQRAIQSEKAATVSAGYARRELRYPT